MPPAATRQPPAAEAKIAAFGRAGPGGVARPRLAAAPYRLPMAWRAAARNRSSRLGGGL